MSNKVPVRIICCLLTVAMFSHSQGGNHMPTKAGIDHILYAASDLQRGMDEIEGLLGVRPVKGGHHPQYGTHNAILSLGPGVYLEVIARDPDMPPPERGALFDVPETEGSRLVAWVYRVADIQQSSDALRDAGILLGPINKGSREKPDGSVISWELTDPYTRPLDGAIPFLIDWGDTVHPSGVVASGGDLVELSVTHPEPDEVRNALSALGAEIKVLQGDQFRLSARIKTEHGLITIR